MPPKPPTVGAGTFAGDAELEVICPLQNQDGSQCRKRCLGEKRYRSMQEHIRRAHPNYYIPKLPATEESFQLMINTPPSARPPPPPAPIATTPSRRGPSDLSDIDPYMADLSGFEQPITSEHQPTAAHAAVALSQLHSWDSDYEGYPDSDYQGLPSIHDTLPPFQPTTRELLPSVLPSPTGRYTSLPPIHRRDTKKPRPRKPSVGQYARAGKHERDRSKDFSIKEFSRRLSEEQGRKAMSAEPPTAAWMQGKRWEDLIEAAASATEVDDDRDLTPMPQSPNFPPASTGTGAPAALQSTSSQTLTTASHAGLSGGGTTDGGSAFKRSSLPPGFRPPGHLQSASHHSHPHASHNTYNASPLQRTLTPPPPDPTTANDPEPFPTIESIESAGSGTNFHIPRSGLSASSNENTSPLQYHSSAYQHSQSSSFGSRADILEHYCAGCGRPTKLSQSFACTECICGVCSDCVAQIMNSRIIQIQPGQTPMRRGCPRCGVMGGKWKRIQLDFR